MCSLLENTVFCCGMGPFLMIILWVVGPFSCAKDRKSTRLNSSHLVISYAVFCLKKKSLALPAAIDSQPGRGSPCPRRRNVIPRPRVRGVNHNRDCGAHTTHLAQR